MVTAFLSIDRSWLRGEIANPLSAYHGMSDEEASNIISTLDEVMVEIDASNGQVRAVHFINNGQVFTK